MSCSLQDFADELLNLIALSSGGFVHDLLAYFVLEGGRFAELELRWVDVDPIGTFKWLGCHRVADHLEQVGRTQSASALRGLFGWCIHTERGRR